MTEKEKKLLSLPWHALSELAIKKDIEKTKINGLEKYALVKLIIDEVTLTDEEIEDLVNDYIYGDRVTFTLWGFSSPLNNNQYKKLKELEGRSEPLLDINGFRGLSFINVKECDDRLEILYVYSKEYFYINEEGQNASVWEQHRGCLWVGTKSNYLACISKHEKMTVCIVKYIAGETNQALVQIKPPKSAIEKCIKQAAISRIVLQGRDGEKTIISRSTGITEAQHDEMERIRSDRFDTSGSYIAEIADDEKATVKYNVKKGSIGIYRHLSATVLFDWSQAAINIILEEIEALKGRPASEIFRELGLETKWDYLENDSRNAADWFLTQVIASQDSETERIVSIPNYAQRLLNQKNAFTTFPKLYCEQCEGYEIPICSECGYPLQTAQEGAVYCQCGAPVKLKCSEGHSSCSIVNWHFPTPIMSIMIEKNISRAFKQNKYEYIMCVIGDTLHIVPTCHSEFEGVEVFFNDVTCFKTLPKVPNALYKKHAVTLNEKCNSTCTYKKIDSCVTDASMHCLPKAFYSVIPHFRPQPHKGMEYGDFSGEIETTTTHYEMKGIIKKNSKNSAYSKKSADELIATSLLSTSKEGEEIIRQFVEQGMSDTRTQLIAIVAPQYIDNSLKGTLRYLARLSNKKVLFIELDEMARLLEGNTSMSFT